MRCLRLWTFFIIFAFLSFIFGMQRWSHRRNNMRKMSVFILIVAAVFLGGCKDKIKPGTEKVERPRVSGIRAEAVTPSVVDEYYETSGTVKAKTVSSVASRVMGTVTSIRVREGDRVAAGHILLTI